MNSLRAFVKVSLLIVYTLLLYAVYCVVAGFLKILRLSNEEWRNLFMNVWSVGVSHILNIRIEVEGTPPAPPFFLVSNHLSYIDIVPLFLNLKCTFVAKKEVRNWPVLGFMVKSVGVYFVDRTKKRDVKRVNELISGGMNEKQGIVVFPEGTTSGGADILPFRPPLLQYSASTNTPVHYCAIRYETDEKHGDFPAKKSVCFYGARDSFHKHVLKLAGNKRIYCKITFCESPLHENDRKVLARKLEDRVRSIFVPMS